MREVAGRTRVVIEWCRDGCIGACLAIDGNGVRKLIQAVHAAKRKLGGGGGGSFQINEFGQVLVPASDGLGRIAFVGEVEGVLLFENPFEDDAHVDLSSHSGLKVGDPWLLPYVGVPYRLSKKGKIYFLHETDEGRETEYPEYQDRELIGLLRAVRGYGGARFIVNHYGIVLTKVPPQGSWSLEEKWEPVFIGRVNRRLWFRKEI